MKLPDGFRLYSKRVPDLDEKEYRACRRATFGFSEDSEMLYTVKDLRHRPKRDGLATMIWDGNNLAAWSLKVKEEDSWFLHFWTNPRYRFKGLATILAGQNRKAHKTKIKVYPDDGKPAGSFLRPLVDIGVFDEA